MIAEAIMAAALFALAAMGVRARFMAGDDDDARVALGVSEPATVSGSAEAPGTMSASPARAMVDVRSPPVAPTVGTVSLAPGVRGLVIDRVKVAAAAAIVPCGGHMVGIGREKARWLDVPCGRTMLLEPGGKTTLR